MNVTTRTAGDLDLPFLRGVDAHLPPEDLAHLVSLGRIMVAVVEEECVGCLRWGMFWDQVPFMNLLFVVPKWRRQGIGATLVTAWEMSHLAVGHTMVFTSTVSTEAAQHLYRRLGYVDSGALFLPDEPTELIFRKALA